MKLKSCDLELFLKDKAFFRNKDCYCLGNSLKTAGKVARYIVNGDDNVELDTDRNE